MLCNHHHYLSPEHFHLPKQKRGAYPAITPHPPKHLLGTKQIQEDGLTSLWPFGARAQGLSPLVATSAGLILR